MTPAPAPEATRPAPEATRWWTGRAELGVCVFLYVVAALVLADAATLDSGLTQQRGPVGPAAVPVLVGVLLAVVATLLVVDVLRGGTGAAEDGEDVDPDARSDWRTVILLAAAFLVNAAVIDTAGWIVSGALLFWGASFALGSRHWVRDPLLAVGLSLGSYLMFSALGVWLPAGPFEGIL
ncbi:tripartite tricarboxylate transporter TctB family protein [Actinorugispora endophytica]|uniref:Putative tricarboxylic transport membrane protein n=1 Tax=Actinorugispora endophytica TaxID=1605990 RepID=A0A4V3D8V3_9ACTN|nr:tripartite tricarboxylate transporter TctB family protein [Actinorugispora endophytica]TDQ53319.1 putative tricarboxylic transport membrane protein [Actinorugispora endophytica]